MHPPAKSSAAPLHQVPSAIWLLLVALAARMATFGNPIVGVDEEFYFTAGRMLAGGAWPYVDVWDRKPVGLFLIYALPGLWPPPVGVLVYQAMALGAVVATAWLIGHIAARIGWGRGSLIAGILYILWLDLADGQGGQSPVFYNLVMAGAAAAILAAGRAHHWRWGMAAMLLVGLALQVKYAVVFEGGFFGLWLLAKEWQASRRWDRVLAFAAMLVAAALLPTVAAFAVYAAAGHGKAFLFANFASILLRRSDALSEAIGNLLTDMLLLAPLLTLALAGPWRRNDDRGVWFVRLWLASAVLGFLAFGSWFNHYTLPVMLPAACCAASFVAQRRHGVTIAAVVALVAFAAGQFVLKAERRTRGTPAEFARLVAAIGRGPGALYVYNGTTMLYTATGRPMLTGYPFPTHLMLAREQGAVGIDQAAEIRRIFARRPAIVVMQTAEEGEALGQRALAERQLSGGAYLPYASLPLGNKRFTLYRLRTPSPPPAGG